MLLASSRTPARSPTSVSLARECCVDAIRTRDGSNNVLSGHEVPAYTHGSLSTGQAALQMFTQIMSGQGLSST